jgi:hypothetical protein
MSVRTALIEELQVLLSVTDGLEDVRVIPSVRALDDLSQCVLIVKTNGWSRTPAAPMRNLTGDFTLTLVSPHKDIDRAEDDLETRLEALTNILNTSVMGWTEATQAQYDTDRICYDIALTRIYKKE